jgi:adenosine/AMP kinase
MVGVDLTIAVAVVSMEDIAMGHQDRMAVGRHPLTEAVAGHHPLMEAAVAMVEAVAMVVLHHLDEETLEVAIAGVMVTGVGDGAALVVVVQTAAGMHQDPATKMF